MNDSRYGEYSARGSNSPSIVMRYDGFEVIVETRGFREMAGQSLYATGRVGENSALVQLDG